MDYVVGSVADLISGNVSTPNRPRIIKKALTPVKRQQSPNVTPKSGLVDDRSIFLSPSVQKKKAIVKKSPKRIFEDQNLDKTIEGDGEPKLLSPKADKVKKHLKNELENSASMSPKSPKSPKKRLVETTEQKVTKSPKKLVMEEEKVVNENAPKKKKKKNSESESTNDVVEIVKNENNVTSESKSSKKLKRKNSNTQSTDNITVLDIKANEKEGSPAKKSKKKRNKSKNKNLPSDTIKNNTESNENTNSTDVNKESLQNSDSKKKNRKNKSKKNKKENSNEKSSIIKEKSTSNDSNTDNESNEEKDINPNAITNADSDSEHESDDEIESETEKENNEILDTGPVESSDNEQEETPTAKVSLKKQKEKPQAEIKEDEVKRTLFVGNVPFSAKCKKEIKKIFSKYGTIETVRIRTVPVKDARVTPKLAVIKNELHPERSTVNVYVKFQYASSVIEALKENNTELNGCHLRVSRSDSTGSEHDPKCSVFVGNLPFAIEDETLRAKFESCGQIESVRIIRDKKTNAGKGFGYVNFASKDGVELALNLSEEDLTIKNRILRVKRCTQTDKKGNKQSGNQGRSQGMNQRNFGSKPGNFGNGPRHSGNEPRHSGNGPRHSGNGPGSFGNKPGNFGNNQRSFGNNSNDRGMQRNFGNKFGNKGNSFGNRNNDRFANKDGHNKFNNNKFGNDKGNERFDGAYRRLQNKRQSEESGDGPKPKKQRKEFVGMTAEKKKKRTFDKGQKKKKALSEILSK